MEAVQRFVKPWGKERYRGTQLFRWIHLQGVESFEEMTNLSKDLRAELVRRAYLSRLHLDGAHPSSDGSTKLVWRLWDGYLVESVLIPEERRLTLCVSSQVGCAMACRFCVTGFGGFSRNLTSAEIVNQIEQAQAHAGDRAITNLVFMGMGEPLLNLDNVLQACEVVQSQHALNFSHRRITLSTVGIVPKIDELGARSPINLAVSLHATTQEMREALIPPGQRFRLDDLMEALRRFPLPKGKVITIEYILLAGVNCDEADARRLVRLLHGLPCKVNLIPYNENPYAPDFKRPPDADILGYQGVLRKAGIHTVTRLNRGNDVKAACGQLGGYVQPKPPRGDQPSAGASSSTG
jgi:23S rRNA (adenine2503-C2)-methyltransferase